MDFGIMLWDISIYLSMGYFYIRSKNQSKSLFPHIPHYGDNNARGPYPVMHTYVLRTHTILYITYRPGHKE
jgi:hypothetical protein